MKKIFVVLVTIGLLAALSVPAAAAFADVPSDSPLAGEIEKASGYGLMQGYSADTFGYRQKVTRAQFAAVLDRMFGWTGASSAAQSFTDVPSSHPWYASIETAVSHGVVDAGGTFRPSDPITRAEMSAMLVRALGYGSVAKSAENDALPFTDVTSDRGYIAVAYEIGMTNGMTAETFAPNASATRAQAAAMLVRIYEKCHHTTDWLHGFYAISSYSQLSLTNQMNAVSAGWSRMTWDGTAALLATTASNGNEYYVPSGYNSVTGYLEGNGTPLNLSVYMDTSASLYDLLASSAGRSQAVEQIVHELTISYQAIGKNPYSGVTVDFEGLKGSTAKADFDAFLKELAPQVHALNKTLYVTVQPVLTTGSYYDGYDYPTIGALADKVILMAHDYDPTSLVGYEGTTYYKNAALTPIAQVYESLKAITDADSGVADPGKIALAISCKAVAWETDGSGKLTSGSPVQVGMDKVYQRLLQSGTQRGYSTVYDNAYATYATESGQQYFLWYEDGQSVAAKVTLAKLFGINGVSVWRLGSIPNYAPVGGVSYNVINALG